MFQIELFKNLFVWLKVFAVLARDLGLVPSNHVVSYNVCPGNLKLVFAGSRHTCSVHIYI